LEGYIAEKDKSILFSCVTSISLFSHCSIFRTLHCKESFDYIIAMALKIKKNIDANVTTESMSSSPISTILHKKKQKNVTSEMIQKNMLNQIPKVSIATSELLYTKYKSVSILIDALKEDRNCLHTLTYETNGKKRKINKMAIDNIIEHLL
jgi:ERCC4-type nuclease